jgi:hypothetical protein
MTGRYRLTAPLSTNNLYSMNSKYMTNGALLVGPVVAPDDITTGETLGVIPGNQSLFLPLSKRFRVRRHSDGWFVDGKGHRSQIWEFGVGKLGLTVTGPQFIRKCRDQAQWLIPKAIGDQEANFYCAWTDENLARLLALTGLQRRKAASAPR